MKSYTGVILFALLVGKLVAFESAICAAADFCLACGPQAQLLVTSQDEELNGYPAIDNAHESASSFFLESARWLDSFFEDADYLEETNTSRIRFKLFVNSDRQNGGELNQRLHVRLRLPNFEDRLSLLLFAEDDDDSNSEALGGHSVSNDHEWTTGFRWLVNKSRRSNISATFGGSLSYVYGGVRVRRYYDHGSWKGQFVEQLRYYTDDGWENKLHYELEKEFNRKRLVRVRAEANWYENDNGLPHGLILTHDQILGPKQAVRFELGGYFNTSPSHQMTDFQLRVRFRSQFYWEWLILEIAPQINFPQDFERQINPGILLRLEADFGYHSTVESFKSIIKF
ncbi:MAG: hypothetical protein ABFS19_12845 [Thermodesulfobacteriota bacterium]